jgi:CubicO group peptidase (beta-lactamase class C family)
MTRLVAIAAMLLCAASRSWAQDPEPTPERETQMPRAEFEYAVRMLEEMMPAWMDSAEVPGLALAFVYDGTVIGARGFGVRSVETGMAIDAGTVFEAASLTKPVVAYAVLQLVDQNVLQLDTPLFEYLPYEDVAHDERAQRITARMVLSHSTGFPNWRGDNPLRIDFDPGSKFQYSGEGFVYLAKVVDHLTGEGLQEIVQRLVFEPLSMWNSSLVWEERFDEDHAVGHHEDGRVYEKRHAERGNAASSLHTTAHDYALFVGAVINGEGLERKTWKEWLSPQVKVEEGLAWGLGWGLEIADERVAFWHWGHNDGYRAFVIASPAQRLGLVLLSNSDNGMSLVRPLLASASGARQPALDWLDYESFNSPRRAVRRRLQATLRDEGVQATIDEYKQLKRHYPEEAFSEALLNGLGYQLMRQERYADAIEIFKLNVGEYPGAFNPYDSLGEAYMRNGEVERAIENYERSVDINPDNSNGHDMLKRLREKLE